MKAGTQKDLPYGSWSSPITAKFITTASVRLGSLSIDREGELHWLEGRPQEKGLPNELSTKPVALVPCHGCRVAVEVHRPT